MPYFLILPAFAFYLLAMSVAVVFTSLHRPTAYMRPYVVSVLIWSSLGFLVSTVIYAIVLVLSVQAMGQANDGKPSVVGGVIMGGMIFVAPFIASATGLLGGAAFGWWRRWRRTHGAV